MAQKLDDLLQTPGLDGCGAAVLDGLAGWVEERLAQTKPEADPALLDEIARFADKLYRWPTPIVITSTEMSLGMMPRDAIEQRLLKIVGSANQILGQQASGVVLMVSGVPLKVR
jgi:adenosyl cobinamide kinase/adenosyl cobinamide phosphate guanylyltransferase